MARRTFSGSQREGAGTHSAFARKPAKQFAMAHAYDRGGHLCRTNRFNVYRLLQTQPDARASEAVVRVISTTRGAAQPFRLKSSTVLSVLKDRRTAPNPKKRQRHQDSPCALDTPGKRLPESRRCHQTLMYTVAP